MLQSIHQRWALRLSPVCVYLVCVALMFVCAALFPNLALTIPARAFFIAVFLVSGASLIVAAHHRFHQANTTANPHTPENSAQIVTSGIYRFSRNPMYLGGALITLASACFFAHALAFLFVVAFIAYINEFQIKPEERILSARFGKTFELYRQRARRWL